MDSISLIQSIIKNSWQPILLLMIVWGVLASVLLYLKSRIKESNDSTLTEEERIEFNREIDALARYVSYLPRPDNFENEFKEDKE